LQGYLPTRDVGKPDQIGGNMDIYHVGINSGEYEEAFTPKFETYVTGEEAAKKLVAKLKRIAKKKEKTNRYSYLK